MKKISTPFSDWDELLRGFKAVSIQNHWVQKNFYEDLRSVKLEMKQFNDALEQINVKQFIAPTKEGDDMSDIIELKAKVNDIDQTIGNLNVGVGKLETELRVRFEYTDKKLDDISDTLKSMNQKMDSYVTKEEFTKRTERSRFTITTWLALAGVVAGIAAVIVPLFT